MKLLLLLYLEFFKVGLFSIGGGMATIPFLQELSVKYGWFDQKFFADMIAISESTPGPIGVNMATYVGYHTAGIPGGIISTLGLISPSIIIILLISRLLTHFKENKYVQSTFYILRPLATGLVIAATIQILKIALFIPEAHNFIEAIRVKEILLFSLMLVSIFSLKKNPTFYIIAGAVIGIFVL
jgi:chromate transporter